MKTLLIVAAGKGKRTNLSYNKIFYKNKIGKSVLELTLDSFLLNENIAKIFNEIILVISPEDEAMILDIVKQYSSKIIIAYGGKERNESVYLGIAKASNNYIYIHDAARPFIEAQEILNLEKAIFENPTINCLTLAVPTKDTVAYVEHMEISANLNREKIYNIQTPQVIKKEEYLKIVNPEKNYTDETSLFIANNQTVKIVLGNYNNIKITTPEDLAKI